MNQFPHDMLKDVLDMFSIVAVARDAALVGIQFQGIMDSSLSWQAHPFAVCNCSPFPSIPQQLPGIGDNDAARIIGCRGLVDSCDEVDGGALVDRFTANHAVSEDAKIVVAFPEEDGDAPFLREILAK